MKLRIVYLYENGGDTMLERLLSSKSIADFLNMAENVSQLSKYDRDMLKKYEKIRESVKEQEQKVIEEANAIKALQEEKTAKQQEVQAMAESTSADITTYVNEISATRAEASALMAEINQADNHISALLEQAEAEKAAAAAAAEAEREAEAAREEQENQSMPDFDPETDTTESSSSSTSSTIIVEEEDDEDELYGDSYEESEGGEEAEESSSGSGSGTYLGNFRLTGYCNCAQCCGTAGNATASGVMPTSGHTVAMAGVPFGTQLSINGTIYTVEDLGTPYGHVDIYFDSHEEALSFGSQYADVYQVN